MNSIFYADVGEAVQKFKKDNTTVHWEQLIGKNRRKGWSTHKWTLIGRVDHLGKTNWSVQDLGLLARIYYKIREKCYLDVYITNEAITDLWQRRVHDEQLCFQSVQDIFHHFLKSISDVD